MHLPLLLVFLLVFTFTIWLYFYLTRNFNHWKVFNISYIKPTPFFGNLYKVVTGKQSIGKFLYEIHRTTKEPFIGIFMIDKPGLVVRDPDLIKHVLIKDFGNFDERVITISDRDDLGANGLAVLHNPSWKTIRHKLSPVFTIGKIKNMLPLLVEAAEDLRDYIKNQAKRSSITEVRDIGMRYATDTIATCFFGIAAHSFKEENSMFYQVANRISDCSFPKALSKSACFIMPQLVDLFKIKFYDTASTDFVRNVFWKHMSERKTSQKYRGDFIDYLIKMKDKSGDSFLDDTVISAQALMFFYAGYETIGLALTFALLELAWHKEVQNRFRNGIQKVRKANKTITYEALNGFKYMEAILCETLRMYPILPFLDRRCCKPYKIPNTDIVLEEGTAVYISILGLHMDPEIFPDPHVFDPDRFMDGTVPAMYMPFGDGPRNCIGSRFAWMALKIALVQIISDFKVETCSKTPENLKLDPKNFVLSPENGQLYLQFKRVNDE